MSAEHRCTNCNKLLFKGTIKDGKVEVKCSCGTLNSYEIKPDGQLSYQERIVLNRKYNENQLKSRRAS